MHIKIYFNEKPLFLTDNVEDDEIKPYIHHDDAVFMDEFSKPGINSILHEMREEKIHAGVYYHPNLEELKKAIYKKFEVIKAAGGVILNENENILMIFRRGKWDLPKGKLDKGETLETCAEREVKEETGLKEVTLEKPLLITHHTYTENGKHILKETHWFLLRTKDKHPLQPQTEEQITKAEWAQTADLSKYLKNTYPLIVDVLNAANL